MDLLGGFMILVTLGTQDKDFSRLLKAVEKQIDEIWLLEHCYGFEEFVPMYDSV